MMNYYFRSFTIYCLYNKIEVAELLGAESILYMKLGNQDFAARVDARHTFSPGDQIKLAFDMNKAHFFDSQNEQRIR